MDFIKLCGCLRSSNSHWSAQANGRHRQLWARNPVLGKKKSCGTARSRSADWSEPENLSNAHLNRNSLREPFYGILIEISIVRASWDTRCGFKAPRSWCMLHNLAENSTEAGEMYASPLSGNMFSVYTRFAVRILISFFTRLGWNRFEESMKSLCVATT